jgi:hypothetical protein
MSSALRVAFARTLLSCSGLFVVAGCGSSPRATGGSQSLFGDDGGGLGTGSSGAAYGGGSFGGDGGGGGGQAVDCSDAAKFVYLVSETNDLFRFDPGRLQITPLGHISCPGGGSVNSMAVDRHAIAWLNYDTGDLFRLDTANLDCQPTSFQSGQAGFTDALGMGFSSDAPGSQSETLFVSDNGGPGGSGGTGKGLGKLDLTTMTLTPIGPYTGLLAGYNAELTGTGGGKLYGFFTTTPANFGEIDKTSGATANPIALPTVNASNGGYAFSFWGGDFWFYTAFPSPTDPGASTSITHYVSATGVATEVMHDIGPTIVGAGVSTCAPQTPQVQ